MDRRAADLIYAGLKKLLHQRDTAKLDSGAHLEIPVPENNRIRIDLRVFTASAPTRS